MIQTHSLTASYELIKTMKETLTILDDTAKSNPDMIDKISETSALVVESIKKERNEIKRIKESYGKS